MLLCFAESREESLLLAKQLATAKADAQKAKAAAAKLKQQLETEQLLRTDAESAAEALKQRLEKLLESSQDASRQRAELAEVGHAADDASTRHHAHSGTATAWCQEVLAWWQFCPCCQSQGCSPTC